MPLSNEQRNIHHNLNSDELIEFALANDEGVLSSNQAFSTTTGKRTGRSPKDRFIVKDEITESTVNWGTINQATTPQIFDKLWHKAQDYISQRQHFISNLQVGADPKHYLPITVFTETAWHALFARNLFIRKHQESSIHQSWTIINAPGLKTDPQADGTKSDGAVIINFKQKKVLICGMPYAGEMKKAMFSVLNFILTEHDVLPMHCAANVGKDSDVALFFGLSGTGKTTLSAVPDRRLIGDDEHGWSDSHVFNFEGGCYAKCIDLSREREPVIWDAIRHGTIMENVVLDPETKHPIYTDASLTQNTRAAYPRDHIENRIDDNYAGQPSSVIFLCCDLYGVLPPVSLLTKEQAAYYFLSGYTALVGSTEIGQTEAIKPTFSTCFGAPFFPRPPSVYAELLMERIKNFGSDVYLVNTGWTGGAYGHGGERFSIPTSRAVIRSILNGEVKNQEHDVLPGFNLAIPKALSEVDSELLDPRKTWDDKESYESSKQQLIYKFTENFASFDVSKNIVNAGPSCD